MRRFAVIVLSLALPALAETHHVVLLHFSDYHSHAVPFYSEGEKDQGGVARAIGYLKREKAHGALVFSGGDTINKDSPAWSDKYGCVEWPWFDAVIDAMAFGNHDADYGADAFEKCRKSIRYPLLSANTEGFQRTAVFTSNRIRVGVFALAGDDFKVLVKTPGFVYSDRVTAARDAVSDLRKRADVVVLIGHETLEDDYALAHQVPGIDVILGTHSHLKRELTKIDGTNTWFISPFQYLAYISRVELTFDDHKLTNVNGSLVRVDHTMKADATTEKKVAAMQRALERDVKYADLFKQIGTLPAALSVEQLGLKTVAMMRSLVNADIGISTTSTFRQPLPEGAITLEMLRDAMPYENDIVTANVTGDQLRRLISFKGDAVYHTPITVDLARTYRVAATDYLANVSPYKTFFSGTEKTALKVRENVQKLVIASPSP